MIYRYLNNLYNAKENEKFLEVFDGYINQGGGLTLPKLRQYIIVLTRLGRFDEAFNMLNNIPKSIIDNDCEGDIAWCYYRCHHPEVGEKLLLSSGKLNINKLYKLGRMYLVQGKIEEAKKCFYSLITNPNIDPHLYRGSIIMLKKICDSEAYETLFDQTYPSLIESGKTFEPGYTVYVKTPDLLEGNRDGDMYIASRLYLVWKVEDDDIYLCPIKVRTSKDLYKLDSVGYAQDRFVENRVYKTSIDNIRIVYDKISDFDLKNAIRKTKLDEELKKVLM